MPSCGSQCYLCDLPIRFDTYYGCSHGCEYCFAKKFTDITKIKRLEGEKQLLEFIQGKRNKDTNWCDWNIPIHWGGLSDPFQPCEKLHKISLQCLKIFRDTQYPFIVSTKGKLIIEKEYLDILKECNCVVQVSMVCSKYDVLEQGCATFEERLEMVKVLAKNVKRVIIRIQPYMHEVFKDVYDNLQRLADAGAYGVIIEGMKFRKKKQGLIKIGGDCCYPYKVIEKDFNLLKQKAHKVGLKIYAGENRLRKLGDSLTCCGTDGLEGFIPNTYNLNHILNGDKDVKPTEQMKQPRTGHCFRALHPSTIKGNKVDEQSFAYNMLDEYKNSKKNINLIMGIDKK